jgi:flagellin
MIINTNMMAIDAYNNLQNTQMNLSNSLEQLSSGYRINKAADDASGLVISSGLETQISGLQQATSNAQNGISVVQTAEGALSSIQSMLQRINQLVVESANTGASDSTATQAAQNEIVQLRNEIDQVANTTSFGNEQLLNGSFGAQEATIQNVKTGLTAGVTVTTTSPTFDLNIDSGSGTSLSVTVTVNAGTYATAASYQAELQADVSAQTAANAGFTGSVTVNVADLGGGAWSVEFVRNSSASSASLSVKNLGTATAAEGVISAASAATTINNGGVFQVGSNVDAEDQIQLSIADARITGGTDAAFTNLAGIDVTDTSSYASAQVLVNNALTEVSNDRGQLGAVQNRMQASISNLQTTTENLQASDSSIVDTDMSLEMVNFTKDQILLQAGTAMLAQANAVPQTILKLLQ